ncbi:MAG: alpha/beta hydrolase family protein [Phycisphaerales bacterium]
MTTRRVEFESKKGHQLSGLLDTPDDGEVRAYALFAHCFTCGKSLTAVKRLSRAMTDDGFGVLRFDFTGLGESEGAFESTSFTTNLDDLEAASYFLAQEYEPPRALIGHSLGCAAALAVASRISSVRFVAVIGAPAEPTHVRRLITTGDEQADETIEVSIGGRPFLIGADFLADLERHDLRAAVGDLDRPLLILHGPLDRIVGIEHAERLYTAAKHPKSFVSLGEADHLVSREPDALFMGHVIAAFAERYATTP